MTTAAPFNPQAGGKKPLELAPELSRLRHLIPLRRLSDAEFHLVMQSAELELLDAGKTVFEYGINDKSIFYLLEGCISIEDDQGGSFTLVGGSIETAHPLSPHPRARRLARATSDVVFVRLPIELLQLEPSQRPAGSHSNPSGLVLEEIDEAVGATDKRIIFDVYHALMDGSFSIPTLPDIALRIRRAASDPDKGVEDIARIAQSDPAIAAYCIRMANNAAYKPVSQVVGVRDAIVRIGAKPAADMITAYTLRELYTAPDAATKAFMEAAWRHSARIAALSFIIADRTRSLNPEQALLGGLLHDIGFLIIIDEWHKQSTCKLSHDAVRGLGNELAGSLSSMVLRNWHMSDSIVTAALESEHWSRNSGIALDVCDCINLAHAHDTAPPPWSTKAPAVEQLYAYTKLPDDSMNEDSQLNIVVSAEAELSELDALLKA